MIIERLKSWARSQLGWAAFILLVFAIIALGEWLAPLRYFQRALDTHPALMNGLTLLTIAMAVLGTLLLVFTQFIVHVGDEQVTRTLGTTASRRRGLLGWMARRFSGIKISAGFSDEASIWEVRNAFRDGLWWSKPRWRRFTLMGLGAFLLLYGLFGLFIVIAPPGVKLLLILALAYATARTIWAFTRAEPPAS